MTYSNVTLASPSGKRRVEDGDSLKRETDNLIEAIWGPKPAEPEELVDPELRALQNRALAAAMRAYLLQYLTEI